jgi:hypothetical protein
MAEPREDVVKELIEAATEGMLHKAPVDSTASEVFSAYMTMALRAVICAKEMGADQESLRHAVERLYEELPPLDAKKVM